MTPARPLRSAFASILSITLFTGLGAGVYWAVAGSGPASGTAGLAAATATMLDLDADARPAVGELFATHCASCHGDAGLGDGPAAYLLFPKPRDFTSGVFRFKSTMGEAPPTAGDLDRVIRDGIPRTAMPGFGGILSDDQIAALGEYVLKMNPAVRDQVRAEAIRIPPQPEFSRDLIAQGQKIYMAMGCAPCHGDTGRGDGASAIGLVDSYGYPLPPANFTTGVFKAGSTPEDLYRTIMVGVPGTPMPSFEAAAEAIAAAGIRIEGVDPRIDMVWAMVAYMDSIVEERERSGIRSGAELRAKRGAAAMLADPFERGWDEIEPAPLAVQTMWQRQHATRTVEVRIAEHDGRLAFLLEWPDATVDWTESLSGATDAAAIMFSLSPEVPTLTMGDAGEALVNLWHWKASRQLDADKNRRHDMPMEFTVGVPVDFYPFKEGDPIGGPLTEHDPTFIPAWGAGNPQADPALMSRPVLCSVAAGFGTLTVAPPEHQNVDGVGRWSNGNWRVLLVREFHAHHEGDVEFSHGARIPISVAVWDGSASDRDGTKLISGWHWLLIE